MTADSPSVQPDEPVAGPVRQLRLVVEAPDFERALWFYREVLGLPEQVAFQSEGDARVTILDAGRATLELANPAQKALIDHHEVGRPVSRDIRVAFEVADADQTTEALAAAGGELLAPPTTTPWRSRNARLEAPAGLQITIFEELEGLADRSTQDGFGTSETRR